MLWSGIACFAFRILRVWYVLGACWESVCQFSWRPNSMLACQEVLKRVRPPMNWCRMFFVQTSTPSSHMHQKLSRHRKQPTPDHNSNWSSDRPYARCISQHNSYDHQILVSENLHFDNEWDSLTSSINKRVCTCSRGETMGNYVFFLPRLLFSH